MAQIKKDKKYFTVSELAETFYINAELIRAFERKKLLSPIPSKQNGQYYSECDRLRLKFIMLGQHADYSLSDIESLIGRVSPHQKEMDQVKESLLYAEGKFNQLKDSLENLDVLEQINITCDLELLGNYIKEMNALNASSYFSDFGNRTSSEEKPSPKERHNDANIIKIEHTIDSKPIQATPGHTKILFFSTIIIVMLVFAVFLYLRNGHIDLIESTPSPSVVHEEMKTALNDNDLSRETNLTGDTGLEKATPESVSSDEQRAEESPVETPLVQVSDSDKKSLVVTQTPGPEALPQDASPQRVSELKMVEKFIKDLSVKYEEPAAQETVSGEKAEPKQIESDPEQKTKNKNSSPATITTLSVTNKKDAPKPSKSVSSKKKVSPKEPEKTAKIRKAPTQHKTKTDRATGSAEKEMTNRIQDVPQSTAAAPAIPAPKKSSAPKSTPVSNNKGTIRDISLTEAKKTSGANDLAQLNIDANKQKPSLTPEPIKKKASPEIKSAPAVADAPSPASSRVGRKTKTNPEALEWALKSTQSLQMGDMSETIVAATVSISLDQGQVEPYINRSIAYAHTGSYEKALVDCNHAIRNDPQNALAFNTRGDVYKSMNKPSEAWVDYEKACALGHRPACGRVQAISGAKSIKGTIDDLLKKSRDGFKAGKWDAAIDFSNQVLKIDPSNVIAYINRSAAYTQKGAYYKAISDCNQALKIDPDYALAFNNRGYAFEKLGKIDIAILDYKKACSLGLELGCQNFKKF